MLTSTNRISNESSCKTHFRYEDSVLSAEIDDCLCPVVRVQSNGIEERHRWHNIARAPVMVLEISSDVKMNQDTDILRLPSQLFRC